MTTILVRGLQLYAYHGVPDAEREVGHRYLIDLEMDVEERASTSDRVEDTVDYGAAAQVALDVALEQQCRTIERLAQLIGEAILAEFKGILEVRVSVEKPMPPSPIIAEAVGVVRVVEQIEPRRR